MVCVLGNGINSLKLKIKRNEICKVYKNKEIVMSENIFEDLEDEPVISVLYPDMEFESEEEKRDYIRNNDDDKFFHGQRRDRFGRKYKDKQD